MNHSNIFRRVVAAMMLVTAFVTAATAQDAFYVYQKDGKVEGFFFDRVQKMEYSNVDTAGITHEVMVAQVIVADDSTYCFMLADIDSVSFVQPEVEYASGVRNMRTTGMIDYLISADRESLTVTFKGDMPKALQPRKNDILLDFDLQAGFGGKVSAVNTLDGNIVAQCEPLTDIHDVFEQFVVVEETGYDKSGNLVRRRVAGAPELTIDPDKALGSDSLVTDTLMTSDARRLEGDIDLPILNIELSGTKSFGDDDGLAEMEAKVKLKTKVKGNYNIPRLRKPHYIGLTFTSDLSLWFGLQANGKLEFSKELVSDKVPQGLPVPSFVPLFELKCLPRFFFDAEVEAKLGFAIRGYQKRFWHKLEFNQSWEPKFTKGMSDIKPDANGSDGDDEEEEGPVSASLEFNGSMHFGVKFPFELTTNWVLRSFVDMSVGTEVKVGPKLSASLKFSFDEMFNNGANAYNALKDTKLSGEVVNISLDAFYKKAKGDKKTLFEGSITPWKEVDLLYLLPAFKEWKVDNNYYDRLSNDEYALHLICKDRPTLFSYPVGMGLYEPGDEEEFVRVGESWFNTYPSAFGSNRWTKSNVTTDHPTMRIGGYAIEMGDEPDKKRFYEGLYKVRPLYKLAGHTLEASPEYDLEFGTYLIFMPRTAHLSNEYGCTATVPIVTNAKEWTLASTSSNNRFSYSLDDKQFTVKLEDYPNYHFFDVQTFTPQIKFNITTQDGITQSRSVRLNVVQEPNRTWLPVHIAAPYAGTELTPENISFLGDKFLNNEKVVIDVEYQHYGDERTPYDGHGIIHMEITPGDTHETYNYFLDCTFEHERSPQFWSSSSRGHKVKYLPTYHGHYTMTGVMESEKQSYQFDLYRSNMTLRPIEVKSAEGVYYRHATEYNDASTSQITTESMQNQSWYLKLQDMTKPGE